MKGPRVFIATVLLESNRWKAGKEPTYRVSDWLQRFAAAGFDGIELWENHALKASQEEVERLANAMPPVLIFNTYATFGPEADPLREQAAQLATQLNVDGIKFNVGSDPALFDVYVERVLEWRRTVPEHIRPLCECHPGTVLEQPEQAAKAFSRWREAGIGAIFHPFNLDADSLKSWFDHLGDAIVHAHVQLNRDGRMQSLSSHREYVAANVQLMRAHGFTGSFALEFTAGIGAGESMEQLFANACDDMKVLQEVW